ncbi:hypothetical protein BC829DRAFT_399102 [Chytridium lagenaria]|nr:hypothetical protein BC829DRAFT_399102 [Chytridium lagenaria]
MELAKEFDFVYVHSIDWAEQEHPTNVEPEEVVEDVVETSDVVLPVEKTEVVEAIPSNMPFEKIQVDAVFWWRILLWVVLPALSITAAYFTSGYTQSSVPTVVNISSMVPTTVAISQSLNPAPAHPSTHVKDIVAVTTDNVGLAEVSHLLHSGICELMEQVGAASHALPQLFDDYLGSNLTTWIIADAARLAEMASKQLLETLQGLWSSFSESIKKLKPKLDELQAKLQSSFKRFAVKIQAFSL